MTKKRFSLLEAYERLTEKESLCLREANFDEVSRIQSKKAKLLGELDCLQDTDAISESERLDFNQRIAELKRIEESNGRTLDQMKRENRSGARSIAKQTVAVSRIQKAYGGAGSNSAAQSGLEDKA